MKISELMGQQDPNPPAPAPAPVENPPAPGDGNPPADDPNNPNPPAPADPNLTDSNPPGDPNPDDQNPDGDGDGNPPNEEEVDFIRTVDAMHGIEIDAQVDYGDVDPLSAEGVFRRESYIANSAVQNYVAGLQSTDPRAYAYLLHRQNGGSDESFFETKSFILPKQDEMKNNPETQKEVYRQILINRGNSPKQADALVKIAIEDGELSKEADAAYVQMKADEDKEFQNAQRIANEKKTRETNDITTFGSLINTSIETNEGIGFQIPQADKERFNQHLKSKIHYEDGNFYIVQNVDQKNINKVIEAELFQFLGGDLNKLVTRKATTIATRRIITKAAHDNKAPTGGNGNPSGIKTLGDII